MGRPSRFSPEVRARAVRMVVEHREAHASEWAVLQSIAPKLGCTAETLRKWVRQAQRDTGHRPGLTTSERERLNPLSVTRGLRALAAFGAFQEVSPGVFANTAVSDLYRDRQGRLRNAFLFWGDDHLLRSAAALGHSMETGESSFGHVFGESFWDWTRRHPSQNEMFNRALAALRSDEHQQIAGAYDWTGVSTVVDVGGGAGSLLAAMRDTDRLLVIEMLTVPCEPNPGIAMLDMMMLLYFGEARQRTVAEYEELFGAARFDLTRVLPTPSAFGIVEALGAGPAIAVERAMYGDASGVVWATGTNAVATRVQ